MKPAGPGAAGLRHWTVVLDSSEQLDALRARAQAAGLQIDERPRGGFLLRDPWQIGVAFELAPAA